MRVSYGAVRFTCSVFARDGIADPASPLSFETCWTYDTDAISVTYRKLHDSPLLVASGMRDDPDSPINKFTFRARAWIAANDKARELGWIV